MIRTLAKGLISLIHPDLCISCRIYEPYSSEDMCLSCLNTLPYIKSVNDARSALIGKEYFPEDYALFMALFYYRKESYVAEMIHRIKYQGQYKIARKLGKQLGRFLQDKTSWKNYVLVPVPIHPKRKRERGFNQAEEMAFGIRQAIDLPIDSDCLIRKTYEGSQTTKDKTQRVDLLDQSFGLSEGHFSHRRVLLIDDVVTTGATLKACTSLLKEQKVEEISIATLGVTV